MPGRDVDPRDQLVEAVDRRLLEGDDDQVAPARCSSAGARAPRRSRRTPRSSSSGVRPLISTLIGVCGKARITSGSVGTRKSAALKPLGALRRRSRCRGSGRRDAAVVVAVVVLLAGREPVRGVQALDLLERLRRDRAVAVGLAVDGGVVHHDHLAVLRHADVQLEHVGAGAHAPCGRRTACSTGTRPRRPGGRCSAARASGSSGWRRRRARPRRPAGRWRARRARGGAWRRR